MKFEFNNHQRSDHSQSGYQTSQLNLRESQHGPSLRTDVKSYRRHRLIITFCLIIVELLIILLFAYYPVSPLNQISKVSIRGNRTVSTMNIMRDMRVKPHDSILTLLNHERQFKDYTLKQNAQIQSIHVKIIHWNHIQVKLSEYPTVAYLHRDDHYFAIVDNGETAHQHTSPDLVKPILFNFSSPRTLKPFIKSYRQIPDSIKPDIEKIVYSPNKTDPNRIHIYMSDGNQVYANFNNWDRKIKYYPAIAKSMKKRGMINIELGAYSKAFKSKRTR